MVKKEHTAPSFCDSLPNLDLYINKKGSIMPSINLSYVNIALDIFALFITGIILVSCLIEFSKKRIGARYFLLYQIFVGVALIADMIGWFGEGEPAFAVMTVISNTVMACACRLAIMSFIGYIIATLHSNSRAARALMYIFLMLCVLSIVFCIGNAFYGYTYYVNEAGHYVHTSNVTMGILYLFYPVLAVFAVLLLALFAKRSSRFNRLVVIVYVIFPVAAVVVDYIFHGLSLTCAGFTLTTLAVYATIYRTRQKELDAQKNALMLSQINPHFIYNTLSTVAAMCDVSPKQAKSLTIDFSKYLRKNIDSLSSESLIPFEQEMEHIECYLKIEKARFRERLNVIYSVQCKEFAIPPLTIQPIVENAIKHGITKKAEGGTIKICTYEEDKHYIVEIIDDGVGFDAERAELHVGIENVRGRIATICHGDVSIKSTLGVGTRVTIEIPKKRGKRR